MKLAIIFRVWKFNNYISLINVCLNNKSVKLNRLDDLDQSTLRFKFQILFYAVIDR